MEAPVESDKEEGSDESVGIPEDYEDEVDINIHFHCEHCFKMMKCIERPKPGWCCELEMCFNGCGHKFHICKTEEHRLMCSHERVPCINAGYGCPHWMQRRFLAEHLPFCPASVIICNAEWNRWALGAKEREKVSMAKGLTALYDPTDLDMALALHDQELVNEMQKMPKKVRATLCNGITRRFPCLPLTLHGSRHETPQEHFNSQKISRSATDEEDDDLTPGLSVSVCTELLRGKKQGLSCTSNEGRGTSIPTQPFINPNSLDGVNAATYYGGTRRNSGQSAPAVKSDDISALCCIHGIIKDICIFCRDDPEEPDFKMGKVWRERLSTKKPGEIRWVEEPRVEKVRKRNPFGVFSYKRYDESDDEEEEGNTLDKINLIVDDEGRPIGKRARFQTPPPAPLTCKGLTMELILKHYSRHQTKPKPMFTFQCMQEIRRSEFSSHYQNVHSEIQEGLDGWLISRCPLHVFGCPYVYKRLYPGRKDGDVVYCHRLCAFGVRPKLDHEPASCGGLPRSRSPSVEKTTGAFSQMRLTSVQKAMRAIPENCRTDNHEAAEQYFASSINLTYLPIEVLQNIACYLDGFSINNLSLTCRLMRDICLSLLNERGLVIIEWVRYIENDKVRWREGRKRRFFSKSFEHVNHWGFKDANHMANHLQDCPFNNRHISEKKFAYVQPRKDGTIWSNLRNCKV